MKGGLSVGRQLEILRNVPCRLGNKTVSVGLKWSVKCRAYKSECRCQATLIFGWMSVSDGKNGSVSGVRNTPFMGPITQCKVMCYKVYEYNLCCHPYLTIMIIIFLSLATISNNCKPTFCNLQQLFCKNVQQLHQNRQFSQQLRLTIATIRPLG